MTLPTYQDYYPYVLKHGDEEKTSDEYLDIIMSDMNVSEEEQLIKNKSGEPTVRNRLRLCVIRCFKTLRYGEISSSSQ